MTASEELFGFVVENMKAEVLNLRPKTVLLEEGTIASHLYLVRKSCLRLFYYSEGKDMSYQFFFENQMVSSFDSLYNQVPSLFSLESIEVSEVVAIRRDVFMNMIESSFQFRVICEQHLIERFREYQYLFLSRIKHTPRQRYEQLLRQYPDIARRVPQHYIASYLGITPVSLSRIRSRK